MCIKNGEEFMELPVNSYSVFSILEVEDSKAEHDFIKQLDGRLYAVNLSLSKEDIAYLRRHRHK